MALVLPKDSAITIAMIVTDRGNVRTSRQRKNVMTIPGTYLKSGTGSVLQYEGVAFTEPAAKHGARGFALSDSTDRKNFRRIHREFADVYPSDLIVCAGTNGNRGLSARRVMVEEGSGGGAFGPGEFTVAMMAGSAPRKIVMNGSNRSRESFANQSNVIPRSATVMVSNGRASVVRRRETVADVLSRESVPTWLMARALPKAAE